MIELLVVIACVAIVLALLIPMPSHPAKSTLALCISHDRQIGLGFIMYADDNQGKFAIQTSITNWGTMEFLDRNQTFPHYQKLSKYLPQTSLFICPVDRNNRQAAANYESLADTNLSYFLNADLSTNNPSKSILSGDRYLRLNGEPAFHGTLVVKTNMHFTWTSEKHQNRGILGFVDGHVEVSRADALNDVFPRLPGVRLSVP